MSVISLLAQHADMAVQHLHVAGAVVQDAALHGKLAVTHASDNLVVLAQADAGPITVEQFKEKLNEVAKEEQLGWLTAIGKYFIGIFQKGGEVFAGFVTGIIPTLVVLMTAFYAVTELVGEERVHGLARGEGGGEARAFLRLDADDLHRRSELLDHRCDARDEPPASDRHHHGVQLLA